MSFGDAFDQFQYLIREHLEPSVERLQIRAKMDPLWDLLSGASNVQRVGRRTGDGEGLPGYEAKWNVRLQDGGLMEGAAFGETQLTKMGPDNALIMGAGATSLHGDPTKVPLPSIIQLKSLLKKVRGMYTINYDNLEAQMVSEPLENLAVGTVEEITQLVREIHTSLWWGSGNGVMGLAPTGGITIVEASLVWTTIDKGQPFRFIRGQRYVAASMTGDVPTTPRTGTGASATTPSTFRCVGVDKFLRKVAFQSEPGQGTITVTAADGIIYNRMWDFTNAASLTMNGVHNLLKASGLFPDVASSVIADIADVPELQALVDGDDTSTATYVNPEPELIDGLLDLMTADDDVVPPVLVAENNLWTLYGHLERRATATQIVPQGAGFEANGGLSSVRYTNAGRQFVIARSPKCRPNTLYGIDRSTFRRFMPTDLMVRWRMANGGAAGVAGIFRPVFVGTQLSDLYTAEFDTYGQITNTKPNLNLIYKGVHNKRTYDSVA